MPAQNGQKVFGAGRFYATVLTGVGTPNQGLVIQDMSLEFKRDIKRLHGINQLPVDVAAGMLAVTGKATLGGIAARFTNDLVMGGSMTTGQLPNIANEAIVISTGATSGNAANAAGFHLDLGAVGTTDGIPLVKVTTGAVVSADQYSVTTGGAYQFSSLAERTSIDVSYLYSTVGGQTVTMTNQPMGKTGGFKATMAMLWGTEKATVVLNNCISAGQSFATKLDDYMKPTFDFEAAADVDDVLGTMSFAELS